MKSRLITLFSSSSVLFVVVLAAAALHCGDSSTDSNTGGDGSADGTVVVDGSPTGSDGSTTSGDGSFETDGSTCPIYIDSDKACGAPTDCAMVARGCYCGQQPVFGISKGLAAKADACELNAEAQCALKCATVPGRVADDGKSDVDGGTIEVDCIDNKCRTVVR